MNTTREITPQRSTTITDPRVTDADTIALMKVGNKNSGTVDVNDTVEPTKNLIENIIRLPKKKKGGYFS